MTPAAQAASLTIRASDGSTEVVSYVELVSDEGSDVLDLDQERLVVPWRFRIGLRDETLTFHYSFSVNRQNVHQVHKALRLQRCLSLGRR